MSATKAIFTGRTQMVMRALDAILGLGADWLDRASPTSRLGEVGAKVQCWVRFRACLAIVQSSMSFVLLASCNRASLSIIISRTGAI